MTIVAFCMFNWAHMLFQGLKPGGAWLLPEGKFHSGLGSQRVHSVCKLCNSNSKITMWIALMIPMPATRADMKR